MFFKVTTYGPGALLPSHLITAEVLYKCDAYYHKESEGGILYNDANLKIDWQIPADKAIISDKDMQHPSLLNCKNNFVFER